MGTSFRPKKMNWEYSYPWFLAVQIRVAGLSSTKWAQVQAVSSLSHFGPWNTSLNFTSYESFKLLPWLSYTPKKITWNPNQSPNWKGTSSSIHLHFLVQNVNFSGCESLKVMFFSSEDKPFPPQKILSPVSPSVEPTNPYPKKSSPVPSFQQKWCSFRDHHIDTILYIYIFMLFI